MSEKEKVIHDIIDFLRGGDSVFLLEHVAEDLGISIDHECSDIYDQVEEKFKGKSFEEIVIKTRDRIIVAMESFITNP